MTDDITFYYDAAKRELDCDNGMFTINAGKDYLNYLVMYDMPLLTPFVETIAGLRDPEFVTNECVKAGSGVWVGGFGSLNFYLYDTDQEGTLLDQSRLTYTIYDQDIPIEIDGKTELPFTFDLDGDPLWSGATNQGREVSYYFLDKAMNDHVLSVQLKYVDSKGNVYLSNRVGYDYATGSVVNSIRHAMAEAQRPECFDLQGRSLGQPRKGLNIVRGDDGKIMKLFVK